MLASGAHDNPAAGVNPAAASTAAPAAAAPATPDFTAEHVQCAICRDVLHKPVSLVPCLHNFCAACCSDALQAGNRRCVICRDPITVRANTFSIYGPFSAASPAYTMFASSETRLIENASPCRKSGGIMRCRTWSMRTWTSSPKRSARLRNSRR